MCMCTRPTPGLRRQPSVNLPESPRKFWSSMVILFLISQGNLTRMIGPLDQMQFAFSQARYAEILKAWGSEGVA